MSTPSAPDDKSPAAAAGYVAGTLTGAAETIMPVRLWITLLAATVLLIFVFQTDSLLNIARAIAIYIALISILLGTAVFSRRLHS